jgi:hypothetical protein
MPPDNSLAKLVADELQLINQRRQRIGTASGAPTGADAVNMQETVALALSGGGIRSATFSLGLVRALSRRNLLQRIDYLSTVSGGSYAGAFLCSLFVPQGRRGYDPVDPNSNAVASINGDVFGSGIGRLALQSLRQSGRYLAPSGTSDAVYAASIAVRNWLTVHLVIGVTLLAVLLLFEVGEMISACSAITDEVLFAGPRRLLSAIGDCKQDSDSVQSVWIPLAGVLLAVVVGLSWAYWMTRRDLVPHRRLARAVRSPIFLAAVAVFAAAITGQYLGIVQHKFDLLTWWLAGASATALFFYARTESQRGAVEGKANKAQLVAAEDRVRHDLSRKLTTALIAFGCALVLLAIEWLAHNALTQLALLSPAKEFTWKEWSLSAVVAAVSAAIPFVRKLLKILDVTRQAWVAKFRKQLILLLAIVVASGVTLVWATLAAWVAAQGPLWLLWAFSLAAMFAFAASFCISFLNLSSLTTFYAAALRRAYLRASNIATRTRTDVVALEVRDDILLENYYGVATDAPVHLINVTINETTTPDSNLILRDRKGKLLTVGPTGFAYQEKGPDELCVLAHNAREQLPLSHWVAISGAAFSTGMGQGSQLSYSLLAGIANLRLGYWWGPGATAKGKLPGWIHDARPENTVQAHLLREWRGKFDGTCVAAGDESRAARRRWYLSDGGHFDNTGLYPLLQRQVGFIIACDNGADPDYRFGDLISLMRRARIDLDTHIEFLDDAGLDTKLGPRASQRSLFGPLDALSATAAPGATGPSAAIAHIRYGTDDNAPTGTLLLIKPRITLYEPAEVLAYKRDNPDFPQQTTSDQFFDESQWDSYFALGEWIGMRLFNPHENAYSTWQPADLVR